MAAVTQGSPDVSRTEVKNTTCYMCACRCGIRVTLRNGEVRYIEGNPDHPLNQGVICNCGRVDTDTARHRWRIDDGAVPGIAAREQAGQRLHLIAAGEQRKLLRSCTVARRVGDRVHTRRGDGAHRNARTQCPDTPQVEPAERYRRAPSTRGAEVARFHGSSFNTREFFHGKSRAVVQGAKWAFLLLAFAVPAVLLLSGDAARMLPTAVLAFAIQYAGLLAERWFFFAQAHHPQNLYFQAAS